MPRSLISKYRKYFNFVLWIDMEQCQRKTIRNERSIEMELEVKLKQLAEDMGADFFGIANLSSAHEAIRNLWEERAAQFPRAISVGISLPHAIVDQQPNRFSSAVAMNYKHHAYKIINQRLDHTSSRLSGVLQREGYESLPIPSTQENTHTAELYGIFSHKMAARLSGLGWIGKCCLLVTPEVGPRVRWGTILTDASLKVTGIPMDERCGDCQECVDICPSKAFTGEPFRVKDSREVRFDAHKCDNYLRKLEKTSALGVCGMCLYVCPYGRKREPQVST
jgi:epoxyqueuosine reductase QueG